MTVKERADRSVLIQARRCGVKQRVVAAIKRYGTGLPADCRRSHQTCHGTGCAGSAARFQLSPLSAAARGDQTGHQPAQYPAHQPCRPRPCQPHPHRQASGCPTRRNSGEGSHERHRPDHCRLGWQVCNAGTAERGDRHQRNQTGGQ